MVLMAYKEIIINFKRNLSITVQTKNEGLTLRKLIF